MQFFWISSFDINLHFPPSTVFNEEMRLLWHIFKNISNIFFVFYLCTQLQICHLREKTVRLHYCHSKFLQVILPRSLKKVEPTSARLDLKCFYNNQRNFFIYVSSNRFNRRMHLVCFSLGIYHCTLLIKVCVYVVLPLLEEIQMSRFECYHLKRNSL